jgi:hypothetical protein
MVSANEYSCSLGAQINFGDLTLYLTYEEKVQNTVRGCSKVSPVKMHSKVCYRELK